MKFYLQVYIMGCGLLFPVVLNNWLGLITNGTLLFILGSIWVMVYCSWWSKVWTIGDLKE